MKKWLLLQLQQAQQSVRSLEYQKHVDSWISITPFLVASLIASVVAILYSKLFFILEEFAAGTLHKQAWFISLPATVILLFASWYLTYRFSKDAGGSGIPQMLIANSLNPRKNETLIDKLIGLKTIIFKIFSSLIGVFAGGAVGQEGPTLQISAGIFYLVGKKTSKYLQMIPVKSFIVAGGAAGLAAAFNTPLGGVAYALEELASDRFSRFRSVMFFSVLTTGLIVQALQGTYLYFGYPVVETATAASFFGVIGIAIIGGLAGALFGKALYVIHCYRKSLSSFTKLATLNVLCALAFWAMIYFAGTHGIGGGKRLITEYLFTGYQPQWSDFLVRTAGPLLMSLGGIAGGLFAPTLAIGASAGALLGSSFHSETMHLLVLIGMVAFLTGFMRTPFTAFVLMLEMTDRHSAIFPMMIAAVIAFAFAKFVDHESFYERLKHDFLHEHAPQTATEEAEFTSSSIFD